MGTDRALKPAPAVAKRTARSSSAAVAAAVAAVAKLDAAPDADDDAVMLSSDSDGGAPSAAPSSRAAASSRPRRAARGRSATPAHSASVSVEGADLAFVSDDDDDGDAGAGPSCRRSAGAVGGELAAPADYTGLALKPDAAARPLWVCPDGRILLETFSPVYRQATDFLVAVAEPVCRPSAVHEYVLTPHSLYAAVSVGLTPATIVAVLQRLSKVDLPPEVRAFVAAATGNFGKAKLVLAHNKFFVESADAAVLRRMLGDPIIRECVVGDADAVLTAVAGVEETAGPAIAADVLAAVDGGGGEGGGGPPVPAALSAPPPPPPTQVMSFEVDPARVERVKARCLPGGLNYPLLEEYDFRADTVNPDLDIVLKPGVAHRPYQDKAMAKMFGNGRARSGIVVLPCGAGKSLVGITAAARVRKATLVLVTNQVSVDQWKHQFKLWTNLQDHNIARFTADAREAWTGGAGVTITTYTMVAYSGRRSDEAARVMDAISGREWGLILLDEVHVVPAAMFRRVVGIVKAHAKLGLTATLVREDALITDLNFLIGPKLYEANWLDLTRAGHIANVSCAEVWCPMTKEFHREYLRAENSARRPLLYAMNPNKFAACALLVDYHERVRRDKVIVFSDNIFALREYAIRLRRPFIYGGTGHAERTRVLARFKTDPAVNTVFLSKVGDNSIDIPEANVLIQISSHAGSRRQEAQRLGRILRAKRPPGGGPPPPDEFNAFFYTLVSTDTQEMYFSAKRQQFLVDQGYAFRVITNLLGDNGAVGAAGASAGPAADLASRDAQLDLLAKVLAAGEEEAGEEVLPGGPVQRVGGGAARRGRGSLAALSGAGGLTYLEYQGKPGGSRAPRLTTKSGKNRHILFRKRAAGTL